MKAILGLGGNLGDPLESVRAALAAVANLCSTRLLRQSRWYLTEAVEVTQPQPPYLNLAAEIDTKLSPEALLGACLGIESALGRTRPGFKAPRTVDIDLLLYEGEERSSRELTLPHPGILRRAFVLYPLLDLYPQGDALGLSFLHALKAVEDQSIELYLTEELIVE